MGGPQKTLTFFHLTLTFCDLCHTHEMSHAWDVTCMRCHMYLTELCRPVSSSSVRQSLCSASRGDLIVPRFRFRRSGKRAFAVSGPHVWNSLFRLKLDNSVTIYYSSRVNWKHFCSSSPEPFCGSISNEGPYKYSILLLQAWVDTWI